MIKVNWSAHEAIGLWNGVYENCHEAFKGSDPK